MNSRVLGHNTISHSTFYKSHVIIYQRIVNAHGHSTTNSVIVFVCPTQRPEFCHIILLYFYLKLL